MLDLADWKSATARPAQQLTVVGTVGSTLNTNTVAVPGDVQALVVHFPSTLANLVHAKIAWHPPSGPGTLWVPLELFQFSQSVYVVPLLPSARNYATGSMTQIDCSLQSNGTYSEMEVYAIFESAPIWLQLFPQPQLEPNQFPKTVLLTLAALTAQWVIQSVANVQITLFNIVVMRYNPSVANDDFVIGYNANLPANGVAVPNAQILIDSTQTAASGAGPMFTIPLVGVPLPRGAGLFADTSLSAIANLWLLVEYSLS